MNAVHVLIVTYILFSIQLLCSYTAWKEQHKSKTKKTNNEILVHTTIMMKIKKADNAKYYKNIE